MRAGGTPLCRGETSSFHLQRGCRRLTPGPARWLPYLLWPSDKGLMEKSGEGRRRQWALPPWSTVNKQKCAERGARDGVEHRKAFIATSAWRPR